MTVNEWIKSLPSALRVDRISNLEKTIQFEVSDPVYMVIAKGSASVHEGTSPNADLTLRANDQDMIAVLSGELNGVEAFMGGKLQVNGDLMLAQQFLTMFDTEKLR
ncbi:SCP-2 sterol transfer family protein [Duganella sp. CF402]|uniref:SCP2 sterol-binding domain-containing protein n=1 Tax=unclassified Duganella TaxID=2636909 RepID=UPI0008B9C72A|nr:MULTISPECIES: SCP2 sterol-binding domain-containing protein [unclassified Duganella]RZT08192.1 SCP-2 sterol transfer family protein [Duganella sp. BK701]SEM02629.1 SCP-2 sterol transfer family protein [Duganella sp. CF402]